MTLEAGAVNGMMVNELAQIAEQEHMRNALLATEGRRARRRGLRRRLREILAGRVGATATSRGHRPQQARPGTPLAQLAPAACTSPVLCPGTRREAR